VQTDRRETLRQFADRRIRSDHNARGLAEYLAVDFRD
jgi:hypothetical protein